MEAAIITILTVFVLLVEISFWLLFRRKTVGIQFSHELDTSFFRFFTLTRVRFLVILHTVFILVVLLSSLLLLW